MEKREKDLGLESAKSARKSARVDPLDSARRARTRSIARGCESTDVARRVVGVGRARDRVGARGDEEGRRRGEFIRVNDARAGVERGVERWWTRDVGRGRAWTESRVDVFAASRRPVAVVGGRRGDRARAWIPRS